MKRPLNIIKFVFGILLGLIILMPPTLASDNDNLFGWAWNPVIGWISFNNCEYDDDCSGINYGVKLETSDAYSLSGYAWNSNVGWIGFSEGYPTGEGFEPHSSVLYEQSTRKFSGWAKILSLAGDSDGWIKMAKDNSDGGEDYGTELADNGQLTGWAWNNKIGWISFNSSNTTNTITYYVTGEAPLVPTGIEVTQDDLNGCYTLNIDWNDSTYADNYLVHRFTSASFTPTTSNFIDPILDVSNKTDDGLAIDTQYYYHVGASNFFGTTYTTSSTLGHTRSICGVEEISGESNCLDGNPSIIKLEWDKPIVASGTEIISYDITYCQVVERGEDCQQEDSTFLPVATTSDCYSVVPDDLDHPPTTTLPIAQAPHCLEIEGIIQCHCREEFTGDDVEQQYVYKIVAVDGENNPGDQTGELVPIYPCSKEKSWRWEEQNPASTTQ
jgi:hypothetical protein